MMKMIMSLFLTTLISQTKEGFDAGSCASPLTKQNVSIDSYSGTWYEIWRDAATLFEFGISCTTAKYAKLTNTTIKVRNRSYYWPFSFLPIVIDGEGLCNKYGQCIVDFKSPPIFNE